MQDKFLIVTARRGSGWQHKWLSPSSLVRYFGESMVGDYGSKMQLLRQVDDEITSWVDDFDDLYKKLVSAYKSSKILTFAILINELNQKLDSALAAGKKVEQVTEEAVKEFESRAGWFSDLKREFVSNRLENTFRKERKIALKQLLFDTKALIDTTNHYLKLMTKARHHGKIGDYIEHLKEISKAQIRFKRLLSPIYDKYLKSYVEEYESDKKQEAIEEKTQNLPDLIEEPKEQPVSLEEPTIQVTPSEVELESQIPSEDIEFDWSKPHGNQRIVTDAEISLSPNISMEDLARLVQSPEVGIRLNIATNPKATPEILDGLASDVSEAVRTAVADHPNTSVKVMEQLLNDASPRVRAMAKTNFINTEPVPGTQRSPVRVTALENDIEFFKKLASETSLPKMAQMILDYSAQIEVDDPETSEELLRIVENII